MKFILSLKTLVFFMFALLLLGAPSCTGDGDGDSKSLCELIEGEWEVDSYEIDGEDQLALGIDNFVMEFKDDDCEGDFNYIFEFFDGSGEEITGEYSIDEDDGEITFEVDGEEVKLDLEVDDDELELSGFNDDGEIVTIEAERK